MQSFKVTGVVALLVALCASKQSALGMIRGGAGGGMTRFMQEAAPVNDQRELLDQYDYLTEAQEFWKEFYTFSLPMSMSMSMPAHTKKGKGKAKGKGKGKAKGKGKSGKGKHMSEFIRYSKPQKKGGKKDKKKDDDKKAKHGKKGRKTQRVTEFVKYGKTSHSKANNLVKK